MKVGIGSTPAVGGEILNGGNGHGAVAPELPQMALPDQTSVSCTDQTQRLLPLSHLRNQFADNCVYGRSPAILIVAVGLNRRIAPGR